MRRSSLASLLGDIDGRLGAPKSIDSTVNVSVKRIHLREFACKVFFSFSVLKKVLFQNLTCQMQDAAYLLMHLVHWC